MFLDLPIGNNEVKILKISPVLGNDLPAAASREKNKKILRVLHLPVAFLLGLVSAFCSFLNLFSPFGISLLAALSGKELFAAVGGVFIGYFFTPADIFSLRYLAAGILILSARWAAAPFPKLERNIWFFSLLSGGFVTATSVVTSWMVGADGYDVLLAICEGLLTGSVTFFFSKTQMLLHKKVSLRAMSATDLCCVAVSLSVFLTGLYPVRIAGLSLGVMAAAFLVLLFAYLLRESGGAIAGVFTGLALLLAGGSGHLVGAFALGGLLCGLFCEFGRLAMICSFLAGNTLFLLLSSKELFIGYLLVDLLVASLLFLLLPSRTLLSLVALRRERSTYLPTAMRDSLTMRLKAMSDALLNVKEAVTSVSSKLNTIAQTDMSKVYTKTAEQVCRHCSMKSYCWQTASNETYNALNDVSERLRIKGYLKVADLPTYFADRCTQTEALVKVLEQEYKASLKERALSSRASGTRALVADQYEAIGRMLSELSGQVSAMEDFDPIAARKAIELFQGEGYSVLGACAYHDAQDKLCIELTLNRNKRLAGRIERLTDQLSTLCSKAFEVPAVQETPEQIRLLFFERLRYTAQFGGSQIACKNEKLCGDAYTHFTDHRGIAYLCLSDGMGSGPQAAVSANMTVSLFAQLMAAGFGYESAVKLVNASLIAKADDETLSTIDAVEINLYSGQAQLLKAGAAPSFWFHRGKVQQLDGVSMPVGILSQVRAQSQTILMDEGDILLCVSDGVCDQDTEWIEEELKNFALAVEMPVLAKRIAQEAKRRKGGEHPDDITVLAVKLQKGS